MNDYVDQYMDQARDFVMGREDGSADSALDENGRFLALASFSGSFDDQEKEASPPPINRREKKAVRKKKAQPKKKSETKILVHKNTDATIEKASSIDSLVFKESSCTGRIGEYFGMNPDNIVVKILAAAKTTQVKENEGLCESMPLPGMPPLIVVGRVTHITPENCPLKFNDRVLGLLPDEMYYSQTYAKLPFDSLMKIKNNLDPWQQVSIALSYLPALQALQSAPFTVGKNKVLLNGGLGPVNQALIRLCQLHNAKKIYVPCEPQYASLVRELGAKPLGPNHSDWGALFYESIDIVIDSIGQNGFITSKVVLVETGHLVVLGSKDMDSKKGELSYPINKAFVDWRLKTSLRTSIFDYMRVFKTDRESFKKDFNYLDKMVWKEELPDINIRVNVDEMNEGGRESDILDGYQIINIPQEKDWA